MVNIEGAPVTTAVFTALATKLASLSIRTRQLLDRYEVEPDYNSRHQFLSRFELDSGAELVCVVNFEPGERQTRDCPGSEDSIEIEAIYCNGADVTEAVSATLNDRLNDRAWNTLASLRDDAQIDEWEARSHD